MILRVMERTDCHPTPYRVQALEDTWITDQISIDGQNVVLKTSPNTIIQFPIGAYLPVSCVDKIAYFLLLIVILLIIVAIIIHHFFDVY